MKSVYGPIPCKSINSTRRNDEEVIHSGVSIDENPGPGSNPGLASDSGSNDDSDLGPGSGSDPGPGSGDD
jgi:hypothetical protein